MYETPVNILKKRLMISTIKYEANEVYRRNARSCSRRPKSDEIVDSELRKLIQVLRYQKAPRFISLEFEG